MCLILKMIICIRIIIVMDLIQKFFSIVTKLRSTDSTTDYECEARISGYFVNKESCTRFINKYKLEKNLYTELRKNSRKVAYRSREQQDGSIVTVCKSSLFREEQKDLWFTINIASEVPIKYNTDNIFLGIEPSYISRWNINHNNNTIEIGFAEDRIWIEIEKTELSDPEEFFNSILFMIKELQQSEYITTFTDYHIISRLHFPQAKPVTLTYKNLSRLKYCKWISPKYDGTRVFLVIRFGKVFELDLKHKVKKLNDIKKNDDEYTVLDCEKIGDSYYIIDIPIYNYQENITTNTRLEYRKMYNELGFPKPFYIFKSINQIPELFHGSGSIPIDGIIILGDSYSKDVYKWKSYNTVDLLVKHDGLYTSDNIFIADNIYPELDLDCIYEFLYTNKLESVRKRPDKPRPNSLDIVRNNLEFAVKEKDLIGSISMRRYHNDLKNRLLNEYKTDQPVLLDIGTGQGGDIQKWKRAGYKNIVCIEPNYESYQESIRRGNKGLFINKFLRDVNLSEIQSNPSVISIFFCMNLFNKQDMDKLREIVLDKRPRYIIGTCLTRIEQHNNSCFTSVLHESGYTMTIHGSHVSNVHEIVIPMSFLESYFRKMGYCMIESNRLTKGTSLSEHEKLLSSFYEYFVFG
jgi:hypothetical protein